MKELFFNFDDIQKTAIIFAIEKLSHFSIKRKTIIIVFKNKYVFELKYKEKDILNQDYDLFRKKIYKKVNLEKMKWGIK